MIGRNLTGKLQGVTCLLIFLNSRENICLKVEGVDAMGVFLYGHFSHLLSVADVVLIHMELSEEKIDTFIGDKFWITVKEIEKGILPLEKNIILLREKGFAEVVVDVFVGVFSVA